jgi:hypothetical protein
LCRDVLALDKGDQCIASREVIEHPIGREQLRVRLGVASIEGVVVRRVQLLNVDEVLGGQRGATRLPGARGSDAAGNQQHHHD